MNDDRVLYEDNHLIAVFKFASDIVQGDKTGDKPLSERVKTYLKDKYNKPGNVFCGVIHRIDRPVSGVLLFAKTSKGLSRMNQLFQKKEVKKTYWAVVKNPPPADTQKLEHFLEKNQKQNKSYPVSKERGKESSLTYQLLSSSDRYHLLRVTPHTGRHHQIRCQLAAIGCPIKGDLKYGFDRSNTDGSIHLHARQIEFTHPISKENIVIKCPTPEDSLWNFFEQQNLD